jgi:hypothetical protein
MQFGFTDRLTCPVRYPNLIYLAILLEKRSNYKFQNNRGSRRTRTFEARRRQIVVMMGVEPTFNLNTIKHTFRNSYQSMFRFVNDN